MKMISKLTIVIGIITLAFANCKKDDCDCKELFAADSIANFVYSLEYSSLENKVYVGLINTGNIEDATDVAYEWYLNGSYIGDGKSERTYRYNNGHFTAVHKVLYKGNEYSHVKEFDITELK